MQPKLKNTKFCIQQIHQYVVCMFVCLYMCIMVCAHSSVMIFLYVLQWFLGQLLAPLYLSRVPGWANTCRGKTTTLNITTYIPQQLALLLRSLEKNCDWRTWAVENHQHTQVWHSIANTYLHSPKTEKLLFF